jgi:hypothetical protein
MSAPAVVRDVEDAARYRILREWHCSGQKVDHPIVGHLLGLVQRRKRWPIPSALFDSAIDAALARVEDK